MMRLPLVVLAIVPAIVFAIACAGGPPQPEPGRGTAWGYVKLVPRDVGDPGGGAHAAAYGDLRLRDAQRVDYSRPGFAVVYTEAAAAAGPAVDHELTIRESAVGSRLFPGTSAARLGDHLTVVNRTGAPQVLSCPVAGRVLRLQAGESAEITLSHAGEHAIHLLGAAGVRATVFAAPGPYAVVSPTGRYALEDLEPGDLWLRSWHPRLPPSAKRVEIAPDQVVRQDLALGVGLSEEAAEEVTRASR